MNSIDIPTFMKILIIEDEINAFEYLQSIIKRIEPTGQVLAHLESVEEAVNWFYQNEAPDLIFLDIQLADGLSFEIFKHVEVVSPVIFTTAYDQYAIDAFKVNSIDYLLKPIHIDDLSRAFAKLKRQINQTNDLSEQITRIYEQLNKQKKYRFLIKKGNYFEFVNVSDIAFIHSEDGMTFLHTFQKKRHLYNNTIERITRQLDANIFFQINRGAIININAIQKLHPYFNNRMKIELNIPHREVELIVSRPKMPIFKNWIDSDHY